MRVRRHEEALVELEPRARPSLLLTPLAAAAVLAEGIKGNKMSYQDAAVELGQELITGETVGEVKEVAGGYGTLEELLEVGLLNVDGYYNALLCFIDNAVDEGFIKPTARHIIVLAPTPKELLDKLEVVPRTKWETTEQLSCCKIPALKEGTVIVPAQRGSML
ncbi:unnamed protein product [Triticum turgidum subsp. durum]|uniref:cytokinin riboside 5'-monophosphate phosphoribohydrolase n=1 Tax=Triticum turgidum subsp. durum TaxID=4567 RepID=A0A9R1P0G3_TRITD|nr:unnamed protein product [Triticum turgidum subsp. durum]